MHSVVTPVPAGTHEFKFVVDGEWKHSTRHPTVGDDEETMNNIRVIRGPPKNKPQTQPVADGSVQPANTGSPASGAGGGASAPKKSCCVVS
jgi:Glycogen recognition site of AMP-activated protein kinase